MKKIKFVLATFAACLMLSPTTAFAADTKYEEGWQNVDDGVKGNEWYQLEDGTYPTNSIWLAENEDGTVDVDTAYMFDKNGYLTYGWYNDGENWYYSDPDTGVLAKGWKNIDGKWYYLFESGYYMFEDGIYNIPEDGNDKYYMFDENGAMTTGWYFKESDIWGYGGNWYYSDTSGVLQTEWQYINGTWYYLDEEGFYMYYGGNYYFYEEGKDEPTIYCFANSGAMITGWYNADPNSTYGNWVYANTDGTAYDGWLNDGGKWYYLDNGWLQTEVYIYLLKDKDGNTFNQIGSTWVDEYDEDGNYSGYEAEIVDKYYVGRDGAMVEGWYYTESKNDTGYYSNTWMYGWVGGSVKAGWVASGSDWYYVNEDGYMQRCGTVFTGDIDNAPVTRPDEPTIEEPFEEDFIDEEGNIDYESYSEARSEYINAWEDYYIAEDKYWEDLNIWKLKNTYVFDTNGKLVSGGWYGYTNTWGTTWYYANPDGTVYNGWVNDGGNWYYIQWGIMLTNQYTPDGYWVGSDGVCQ